MLCTAFEEWDMHRFQIFLKLPHSVTPIRIIPVIKRLRNLGPIQLIAKSSYIYTQKSVCITSTSPFGEVGGILLYNFHCEHILLKLKTKSYCEKLSLKTLQLEFSGLQILMNGIIPLPDMMSYDKIYLYKLYAFDQYLLHPATAIEYLLDMF